MPNDARHGPRMNRRLPFGELASSFRFGEIDALQSLIDKPNIMIVVNSLIESFGKQHLLLPSLLHLCKSHYPLPDPTILPQNQNQNQVKQPLNRQAELFGGLVEHHEATDVVQQAREISDFRFGVEFRLLSRDFPRTPRPEARDSRGSSDLWLLEQRLASRPWM